MKEILTMDKDPDCPGHEKSAPGEQKSTWIYSTGGIGETYLACPNGCGKMYKKITEYGDEKELEHECKIQGESQQVNKSTSQQVNKSTSQQVNKSTSQQVNKSTSQQVNKSTSQQVNK